MPYVPGDPGKFEVFVDGELIASRQGGFFTRLLHGGWPDPEDVVRVIEERLAALRE